MEKLEIDPVREAEIAAEFRELAETGRSDEAAEAVAARYGLTADQVRQLARKWES